MVDNRLNEPPSIEEVMKDGVNCQLLIHLLYKELGVTLPPGMWSQELYQDELQISRFLEDHEEPVLGDIFFFMKNEKEIDYKKLHLAMFTGNVDTNGDPLLIHATNIYDETKKGGVKIWPLSHFLQPGYYEQLFARRRLVPELFETFIKPLL